MHGQSLPAEAKAVIEDAAAVRPRSIRRGGDEALSESPNETRPERLDALTGLRFIAAFCVLFEHSCVWLGDFKDSHLFRYGATVGIYAMPLFFVLSGFVIHYNYSRLFATMRFRWAAAQFLGARIARLYPLMLACFAVGLFVDHTSQWLPQYLYWWCRVVLSFLTMTQSWSYVLIFDDRLLLDNAFGLAWSISTEFFFYIAYLGLVFLILPMRTPRTTLLSWIIFVVMALLFFYECKDHLLGIQDLAQRNLESFVTFEQRFSTSFIRWLFYYSPYSRIAEFIVGCLTAHLYLQLNDRPIGVREQKYAAIALWAALFALLAIGFFYVANPPGRVLSSYTYLRFLTLNFICAAPIGILIFCVARYETALSNLLSHPRIVLLGEMSYSIYAVHTWTLRIFEHDLGNLSMLEVADTIGRIVLGIAVTLIVSTATFRLIEVPGRRKMRDVFARLTTATMGAQAANMRAPRLPAGREASVAVLSLLALAGVMFVFVLRQ